ncbi:ATP-binding cassette domain-containing protein [Lysinibacillus fusiformis]|uniref:ATP-binding cassette domain-containing protein n=1 Tax=Lysinibacillus fusiformis TaxID=28031 RepID=UPI00196841A8|nr:ATP-binding cassette domain-containing protein [Lysinibacillus fusiformis]QSB12026.1 ATP-binding cassette domain-containing protein [Lysinibacillus fusiformis]
MLILQDLKKSYTNKTILKSVSATFQLGQCYLILGENGAGKSTLFRCITGDEKFERGTIHSKLAGDVADLCALQYQSFESYSFLKIKEVIQLFSTLIKQPAKLDLLHELLEFKKYENTLIKNASGGQRKALSLYLTFLMNKPFILLDEPFADLDLKKKSLLLDFLKDQVQKYKKCLIIISHEVSGVESLFDFVYFMKDGAFIEGDTSTALQEKYKNPLFSGLEGVYFEVTGQMLGGN